MSKLGQLRKKVRYETDIARCSNCKYYKQSSFYLRDSLPKITQALCGKHGFTVSPNAVCDSWGGENGATLIGDIEEREVEV